MKRIKDLHDLFIEQLRGINSGEAILKSEFNKTFGMAINSELKAALTAYQVAQEEQCIKLQQVFEILFYNDNGEKDHSISRMIEDTQQLASRCEELHTRDAALITCLQHIAHYKIATYGALSTYARRLEHYTAGEILHQNLMVEKEIDRTLVVVAEGSVNSESLGPLE